MNSIPSCFKGAPLKLSDQAMSTMGKFVLLCCHSDTVILKHLLASFCSSSRCGILGVCRASERSPTVLWDCGSLAYGLWVIQHKRRHAQDDLMVNYVLDKMAEEQLIK